MLKPRLFTSPATRGAIYFALIAVVAYKMAPALHARGGYNGFDVSNALIPANRIEAGGPPRDGIPALSNPQVLRVPDATYLDPNDRVLGIDINGAARAYPIRILNWHEVVNDVLGDERIVVTYCPLCATGMVFAARVAGKTLRFGVSGLLYNSDMLLYDRATESLWSQILGRAISGELRGSKLTPVAATYTSWSAWSAEHPSGTVLDVETGFRRDYTRDPYAGYENSRTLYFNVDNRDRRFHEKDPVVGLVLGGKAKVWPLSELEKINKWPLKDSLNAIELQLIYRRVDQSLRITDPLGKELAGIPGYWFAWLAFYPNTEVFSAAP